MDRRDFSEKSRAVAPAAMRPTAVYTYSEFPGMSLIPRCYLRRTGARCSRPCCDKVRLGTTSRQSFEDDLQRKDRGLRSRLGLSREGLPA